MLCPPLSPKVTCLVLTINQTSSCPTSLFFNSMSALVSVHVCVCVVRVCAKTPISESTPNKKKDKLSLRYLPRDGGHVRSGTSRLSASSTASSVEDLLGEE
uniref:(northern house mosquito) hypothetical protein n=1 Tax=Culex pipiens TaxID=7175 RepID=A0A8D8FRF6_CULPI